MRTISVTKRHRGVVLASVALGALAVAGCNLLVSAGDYHVGEGPEDATTGDGAPINTADGSGDSNSPLGDANGSDSNPAPPNDGGTEAGPACGSTLQVSSVDFQQLIRSCVLDTACDYFNFTNDNGSDIGNCIAQNSLAAFGATSCELTAQTCADIEECTGAGFSNACDGGATTAFCTGNVAQNCSADDSVNGGPGYLNDCTKFGGTCKVYADDAGDPVADCEILAKCTDPDPSVEQCNGNDLYTCVNGVGYGVNCQQFQSACGDGGPNTGATCIYNAASCGDGGAAACDQGFGQVCYSDSNQLGRFNCGRGGLNCVPLPNAASGDYPFECLAPGCTDNDVSSCISSCSGTVATFCVGGAAVPYDCADVKMGCDDSSGFAQCYQAFAKSP